MVDVSMFTINNIKKFMEIRVRIQVGEIWWNNSLSKQVAEKLDYGSCFELRSIITLLLWFVWSVKFCSANQTSTEESLNWWVCQQVFYG